MAWRQVLGRRGSLVAASVGAGGMSLLGLHGEARALDGKSSAAPTESHRIVVVGGGSAGLGVAAQLKNAGETDIVVCEPSSTHYYQPMWTLVGAGIFKNTRTARPEADVMPRGVHWVKDRVTTFLPEKNQVVTAAGKVLQYEYLVVAAGLQIDWDKIKGLKDTIGRNGVVSIYDYQYSQDTWEALRNLKHGKAIFTQPPTPVKCGGAPQKIMWLTDDYLRKQGNRDEVDIVFALPQKQMFGVKRYADVLEKQRAERGVKAMFGYVLTEVDGPNRAATFKSVDDGSELCMSFNMLHVVPPMGPPDFIKKSPLANKDGWVDVNSSTLQHSEFPNVFAIGDCSSLPTSKTMAAITSQAPVLVHNLLQHSKGKPLTASYNGYTSCPIVLGYSSLLLAEFKYNGEIAESMPRWLVDQSKPSYPALQVKKYVFPFAYWELFLRGHWYGPNLIFKPSFSPQ